MSKKDKGGWSSKGMEMQCPKCGEIGRMIETTIYGRRRRTSLEHFCNTCAFNWETIDEGDEDDDRD